MLWPWSLWLDPGFNPYGKVVHDLRLFTNLRLTFTRLHTLGNDNLLENKQEVMEKYYYAISGMVVSGSCLCYGHARQCVPARPEHENISGMVHGICKCEHNTM